jgi:hypothetical protein
MVNDSEFETTKRPGNHSRTTRRKLVKYTLGAIATAAFLGAGYCLTRPNNPPMPGFEHSIVPSGAQPDFDYTGSKLDLRYINPTSEEVIKFFSNSEDASVTYSWYLDGRIAARTKEFSSKLPVGERKIKLSIDDTLQLSNTSRDLDIVDWLRYRWSVDRQQLSSDKDYSLALPAGEHEVGLCVSDGKEERCVEKAITMPESLGRSEVIEVEPDQLYPPSELKVRIKGVVYIGELGKNDVSK